MSTVTKNGPFKKKMTMEGKKINRVPDVKKDISGFDCFKFETILNGKTVEIYANEEIGLNYCIQPFDVKGFALEIPGYNKLNGHHTLKATSVDRGKIDDELYSLEGFKIYTKGEYEELKAKSIDRSNDLKLSLYDEKAPKINILTIYGDKYSWKDLVGKVVVLNFWYANSALSKKEIPLLNKLKAEYEGENVVFIGVAMNAKYKIFETLEKHPFDYELVEEGRFLSDKYGIKSYPTNIVISKTGYIKFIEVGYKKDIIERMSPIIDQELIKPFRAKPRNHHDNKG